MRRSGKMPAGLTGLYWNAGAAAIAFALASAPADAAQTLVPRIDSFGPYKLGMTLDQARAAHKGGKPASCGDVAAGRQCIVLDAAVFDEPGVIYAVLDAGGTKVERIVAQLDPQLTQRRAYRCVRLAEKVFSLLAVVYGSKFKQSYDQNRRPLPAVAWDGELYGRLIFETKCRTADEGNPRISIVEFQPEVVDPPKVAEKVEPKVPTMPLPPALSVAPTAEAAPGIPGPVAIDAPAINPQPVAGLPASISLAVTEPVPARAPIGVVEEIKPDISGAVAPDSAMAALARELAQAKGKAPDGPVAQAQTTAASAPAEAVPPAPVAAEPPAAFPAPVAPASVPVPPPAAPASIPAPITVAQPDPAPTPMPVAPSRTAAVEAPTPAQSVDGAVAARLASPASVQPPRPQQTAALPPAEPGRPGDEEDLPKPPITVAPEPFMMPEEEEFFRQRREAPQRAAVAQPQPSPAASAPFALLSVTPPAQPRPQPEPQPSQPPVPARDAGPASPAPMPARPAAQEAVASPSDVSEPAPAAKPGLRSLAPVLTGGWRHRAPVPPVRPWRERIDAGMGAS